MCRFFLLVSLFLFALSSSLAQTPQVGLYEFGAYDTPGFDTINRGNLNVHLSIPIFSRPGRAGTNFSLVLNYDGLTWRPISSSGISQWSPSANWGWTTVSNAEFGYVSYNLDQEDCTIPPKGLQGIKMAYGAFAYHDAKGRSHPIPYAYTSACNSGYTPTGTGTYALTDNSGYTVYRNGLGFAVFTKTGEQFGVSSVPTFDGTPATRPTSAGVYTDTNGNQISATYNSSTGTTTYSDTLGTTALTVTGAGTPTSPMIYTYTDTTGTSRSITVNYTAFNIATSFGVSGTTEYSGNSVSLISSIVYPDGSQYSFTYENTPGSTATYTGRLASVTLPTGGEIGYAYTGGYHGVESDGSTSGLNRTTTNDGTVSTVSYTRSGFSASGSTTTYTDTTIPTANTSVSTYLEDGQGYIYETSRSLYAGAASGTPLQQVTTCYSQTAGCPPNSVTAPILYQTTTTLQNGISVGTDSRQFSGGFLTSDDDGGVKQTTAYQTFTGPYSVGFARVSSVTDHADLAGSPTIAKTTYAYDQTTPTITTGIPHHVAGSGQRGNLTTVSPWLNTTNATDGATTIAYYDTGAPVSGLGPTGTTTYGFDGTQSFLTGITPPTPSSNVSLPIGATYDSNTGLPLTSTDPNMQVVNYKTYDSMLRPTEIDFPDGGTTTANYYPAQSSGFGTPYSVVTNSQSASQAGQTYTLYDGYGRTSRVAVWNGQNFYQQDSCYDTNGRLKFQSYTYQSTGFNVSKVCSGSGDSYVYDALGRVTSITHADGTYVSYSYTGRATRATDENGVSRITQIDGHGRITSVCEISSSTLQGVAPIACGQDIAATGFLTSYAYTTDGSSNQVTTITQGMQTRVFKTDSLGRSVSVTEPERGTTTYGYAYSTTGGLGLAVTRQRPRANQTNAGVLTTTTTQYDALARPVSLSYNDSLTPSKQFDYDIVNSAMSWSETTTNLKGRMADMASGSGTTLTRGLFSYDAMGRVLTMWQCAPSICGTTNQAGRPALSFSYDWTGNLTGEFDGASGLIGYTRSPAGEVTAIAQESYQGYTGNPANIVSNVVNGANGPTSYTLGNGLNVFKTYDGLGRPKGQWLCNGPASQYCAAGGTQLYGSQPIFTGSRMVQLSDTALNQQMAYGYDDFNRLISRTVFQGAVENFTYSYDRYGNRLTQTLTAGSSGPQASFSVNAANNQIAGYTYDAAGNMTNDGVHSYTYDAEGNILTVDGGGTASYTYDAANRRVRAQTGGTAYEYLYDYAGRRTSSWLNPSPGNPGFGNEGRIYWDGQQIAFRAWDGTTYFEHQDWEGTERLRTTYTGAVAETLLSLPWGDGSTTTIGGAGANQDNYLFAGLDADTNSAGARMSDHAQFRNYSFQQGRWLSPDPYNGSYDITNPQSFNRYAYVLNNPLSYTDPLGLDDCPPDDPCPTPPAPPDPGPCEQNPLQCYGGGSGGNGGTYCWDWGICDIPSPPGGGGTGAPTPAPSPTPSNGPPPNAACQATLLNMANQQLGTNFNDGNITGFYYNGTAYNIIIQSSQLTATQFNNVQQGRYTTSGWQYLTGFGLAGHVADETSLGFAQSAFISSNVGGNLSVQFAFHDDNGFADNPLGFLEHLFTDVFGHNSRKPC